MVPVAAKVFEGLSEGCPELVVDNKAGVSDEASGEEKGNHFCDGGKTLTQEGLSETPLKNWEITGQGH